LPSITDFPFTYALAKSLNEADSWTGGLLELYYVLAQDFLYPNPNMNLIFADNHDLNRIYTTLNHNFNKYKMAMAILATMRGIPQLYYGTEILMDGDGSRSHGYMRQDFPGGWEGDYMDAFKMENISTERKMAFEYVKKLLNWRKNQTVIHTGKLMHFIPENGIYVYFRYNDKESVMVIINKSNSQLVPTARYNEILKNFSSGKDVITNETIKNLNNIYMEGYSARIIELEN
jgi:neopullulanase